MIRNILLVGLGGSIGSILRYLCQRFFNESNFHTFPWATFLVNIIGCLIIGIIFAAMERSMISQPIRLLLATGFCGGFTTFSAFALENVLLMKAGETTTWVVYTIISVVVGIASVFAGIALGRSF